MVVSLKGRNYSSPSIAILIIFVKWLAHVNNRTVSGALWSHRGIPGRDGKWGGSVK
jgi:hypothetical protein